MTKRRWIGAAPMALSSLRAQFYGADFRFSDYTVETWNGTTWVTAATVVAKTSPDVTTALNAASTDRFRLVATAWNSLSASYGPALRELTWT